jgi:magnesium transporter
VLAVTSGLLIGSSFVFKKKGLLRSQAGGELGEGVAYLKSVSKLFRSKLNSDSISFYKPLWWVGMSSTFFCRTMLLSY